MAPRIVGIADGYERWGAESAVLGRELFGASFPSELLGESFPPKRRAPKRRLFPQVDHLSKTDWGTGRLGD